MKKAWMLALATGLVAANLVRVELVAKEPERDATPAGSVAGKAAAHEASAQAADRLPAEAPPPLPNRRAYAAPQPIGAGVPALREAPPAQAAEDAPRTTRSYAVEDVVRQIREDRRLGDSESREFLLRWLANAARGQLPPSHAPQSARRNTPDVTGVWLSGDRRETLQIETTAAGHERIAEALKALREYGLAEITIRVLFLTGPAEELQQTGASWAFLPADLPATAGPSEGPVVPASFDAPLAGHDGPQRNRARVVIERDSPVVYQVLDEDAAKAAMERWNSKPRVNLLMAPKVRLYNGQTAQVSDASQSPFVVGIKDGLPQIRIVSEGVFLQLRPLLDRKGKLRLDFSLTASKIRDVKTVTVSNAPGTGTTVQVPEVGTACVEARVEMPLGRWLLLRGPEQEEPHGRTEATAGTAWEKWLLPSGLQRKAPQRPPVSTFVMLWVGRAEDAPQDPLPPRRDK